MVYICSGVYILDEVLHCGSILNMTVPQQNPAKNHRNTQNSSQCVKFRNKFLWSRVVSCWWWEWCEPTIFLPACCWQRYKGSLRRELAAFAPWISRSRAGLLSTGGSTADSTYNLRTNKTTNITRNAFIYQPRIKICVFIVHCVCQYDVKKSICYTYGWDIMLVES